MSKIATVRAAAHCNDSMDLLPSAQDLAEAVRNAAASMEAHGNQDAFFDLYQGQERRGAYRSTLQLPVIFQTDDRVGFGSTSDVSLGGMFIETDEPCLFGEQVMVKFRAGGLKQPLSAPAVVRWVERDRGMGVQFESVRPLVIWALQQELKKG